MKKTDHLWNNVSPNVGGKLLKFIRVSCQQERTLLKRNFALLQQLRRNHMTHVERKTARWNTPMILALSLVVGFPTISQAIATYDAITLVDLTITGSANSAGPLASKPNDLLISGDARVVDADAIMTGNAFADQFADTMVIGNDPNNLDLNEGLSQQAIATGDATQGLASSFAFTEGILGINNTSSTESYRVDFLVDWSYLVETSITDPLTDSPSALSEIRLVSTILGSLLDVSVTASTLGGDFFSDMEIFPFSVLLAPGESDVLTLTANAAGIATVGAAPAPVPEPSTFALMIIGLIGMALMRRRNGQADGDLELTTIASKN